MSQRERLATFGKLMGEHKLSWNEYAYIIREIPYVVVPTDIASRESIEDTKGSTSDGEQNHKDEVFLGKVKDIATLFSAG